MASQGHNSNTSAVHGGSSAISTPANSGVGDSAGRRNSNSGTLFSGLMNQKRNSIDAATQARKQSFSDQKPATGVIGKMWNNFTTGGGEK